MGLQPDWRAQASDPFTQGFGRTHPERPKTFGIRMAGISQGRQRDAFRDQLAAAGGTDQVLRTIANGFITAHATLCQVANDLDKAMKKKAKAHPVVRRLMTVARQTR